MLSIGARRILSDLRIGDSVAVNGVCLTAAAKDDGGFIADVMHETLKRSSLGGSVCGKPCEFGAGYGGRGAASAAILFPATSTAPESSPPSTPTKTPSGTQ